MSKDIRIAITGKMRAGKDTVYLNLENEIQKALLDLPEGTSYSVKQFAFGDSLKEKARAKYPSEFENGAKPRRILQEFGQSMRATKGQDVWVNFVDEKVKAFESEREVSVSFITDVRQQNEFDYVLSNGYYTIKVVASDDTRISRMKELGDNFSLEDLSHETELNIDSYHVDYIITTDDESIPVQAQTYLIAKDILEREGIKTRTLL